MTSRSKQKKPELDRLMAQLRTVMRRRHLTCPALRDILTERYLPSSIGLHPVTVYQWFGGRCSKPSAKYVPYIQRFIQENQA